jgi:hypothetical protein
MPRYCHNRPLGTTPNAKIRIRTTLEPFVHSTVRFGSKNRRKDVEKMRPRRRWRASGRFFAYFGTRDVRLIVRIA